MKRRLRNGLVRRTLPLVLCALPALSLALGCGGGAEGQGANAAHARPGGGRPPQPAVPVSVEPATVGAIASYHTATATLEAEKEAEILARVTGVVERLDCEEGDRVVEGQALLHIENDEYRFRLQQAEANAVNQQARYDRLAGVFEQRLVSAEEFEAARNELASARAEEELARLNLSYTTVEAPFGGRVVERLVDVGQNVSAGTPLFRLADFEPLLARVHVPSKEFRTLRPDQPVRLVLDSDGERLEGRIKLVSPVIDASTGTIKITVEVPRYPAGTRPGDFAQVQIVTERREGRTLVPRIAVVTDKGDDVVFVAADSTAERRVVEVGFLDDDHAEILDGVAEGERIIVKGQRSLKHGDLIRILGHDEVVLPERRPEAR